MSFTEKGEEGGNEWSTNNIYPCKDEFHKICIRKRRKIAMHDDPPLMHNKLIVLILI
jgi:hypothetical protein